MSLFKYNSYQEFLRSVCKRPGAERGIQAALAKAAGCQASYFSQVLQEKAHLTEDQAIGISEHLNLTAGETEHFLILLRFGKANTIKLKSYLENRILQSRREHQQVGQKVPAQKILLKDEDIGRYFSSWIPSAVHLLTSHPDYGTAKSISQRLSIPIKNVEATLRYLEKLDFIEFKEGAWTYKGGSVHIPKNSPWQQPMQDSRRQLALRSIAVNPDDAIHFSSVFTIDQKDVEEIKQMIEPFLDRSHRLIQNSGTEALYCFCLDLFSII